MSQIIKKERITSQDDQGELHSNGDHPSMNENTMVLHFRGDKHVKTEFHAHHEWHAHGRLHRETGPAVTHKTPWEHFHHHYQHGQLHGSPAVVHFHPDTGKKLSEEHYEHGVLKKRKNFRPRTETFESVQNQTFHQLREKISARFDPKAVDNEESRSLEPRVAGEREFKDGHRIKKIKNPAYSGHESEGDKVFTGGDQKRDKHVAGVGAHKSADKANIPSLKAGSSRQRGSTRAARTLESVSEMKGGALGGKTVPTHHHFEADLEGLGLRTTKSFHVKAMSPAKAHAKLEKHLKGQGWEKIHSITHRFQSHEVLEAVPSKLRKITNRRLRRIAKATDRLTRDK